MVFFSLVMIFIGSAQHLGFRQIQRRLQKLQAVPE